MKIKGSLASSFTSCTMEKKTSEEWTKLYNITIVDPDGWNRKNYDFSFYKEKISFHEFKRMVELSTVINK